MKNLSTLTPNDLAIRKNYITATDVPAIMGTTRFKRNRLTIYLEKCGDLAPVKQTSAMIWGQLLEGPIIKFTEVQLREHLGDPSLKATKVGTRRRHPNGIMSTTLDAVLVGRDEILEAKSYAALHDFVDPSLWGEAWTDDVPVDYLDQTLAQLACCPEMQRVWLVVSIGREEPVIYCIERSKHLERIALIENTCCDFWDRHIVPCIPPEDTPLLETVKRDRTPRQEEVAVVIPDDLLEKHKELGEFASAAKKARDGIEAQIKFAMIGTTKAITEMGHVATIKKCNRAGYTVEACEYDMMTVKLKKPAPPPAAN